MKKFPGKNTVSLNEASMHEVIKQHLGDLLGGNVRITSTKLKDYPQSLEIEFTTDPDPSLAMEQFPEPAPTRRLERSPREPVAAFPSADDDHPF